MDRALVWLWDVQRVGGGVGLCESIERHVERAEYVVGRPLVLVEDDHGHRAREHLGERHALHIEQLEPLRTRRALHRARAHLAAGEVEDDVRVGRAEHIGTAQTLRVLQQQAHRAAPAQPLVARESVVELRRRGWHRVGRDGIDELREGVRRVGLRARLACGCAACARRRQCWRLRQREPQRGRLLRRRRWRARLRRLGRLRVGREKPAELQDGTARVWPPVRRARRREPARRRAGRRPPAASEQ